MELDIERLKELIQKREEIDTEIIAISSGKIKKLVVCSNCKQEGHTARTCTKEKASGTTNDRSAPPL
jgi:transposase-like protein